MRQKLQLYRFEIFLITQLLILFESLVFRAEAHTELISYLFFLLNIVAGINILVKKRKLMWFFIGALIIEGTVYLLSYNFPSLELLAEYIRMTVFFLFYVTSTYLIIQEIWHAKIVNKLVIYGLMSGYLSLGFIGTLLFLSIETWSPNSFNGISFLGFTETGGLGELMYFSYITLLTIGYGEIYPISALAQKATILVALMGQFYTVIITAIIVGKFINQSFEDKLQNK
jgi:voltage-gated potassium channel